MGRVFWLASVIAVTGAVALTEPWLQPNREIAFGYSISAFIVSLVGILSGRFVFWLYARRAATVYPSQRAESMTGSLFLGTAAGALCVVYVVAPIVERFGGAPVDHEWLRWFIAGAVGSGGVAVAFGSGLGQRPGRSDLQ